MWKNIAVVRHYHSRYHYSYRSSGQHHFYSNLAVLVLIAFAIFWILRSFAPANPINLARPSYLDVVLASFSTLLRLTAAYVLAIVFALPLFLLTVALPKLERYLLPIYDILQSIPVLAFFPAIVLVFINLKVFDGAAVFVLFVAMLWNLVFSMVGGLKTVPVDIDSAARVFGAVGHKKLLYVTLPAILPYIITGSLLAWGQAWAIIIVAESIHNYIPGGNPSQDLFGLGSLLSNAAYSGDTTLFLVSLLAMIVVISLLNFFVWQKLLHLSERFRFD